jgi:hypothetical protein
VDWAVVNNGVTTTGASFDIQLLVDGLPRTVWTSNPLSANFYTFIQDYPLGSLSVGTHTIRIVADSGGAISETNEADNEYTKAITIVSAGQANLTPFQPSGWTDKLVVSNITGTSLDSSLLRTTDTLFVDWAVLNNGSTTTGASFDIKLLVDGVQRNTWSSNPLSANFFAFIQDYPIGSLAAGTHTVKIVADSGAAIPESNEADNEYTKTITVAAGPSTLQFNATNYNVAETDRSVTVTVTRTGDTSGVATVDFATNDGSAIQSKDYEVANGTLSFAAGVASRTFRTLIVDDLFVEGNETFTVTLTNATGATLGGPSVASVTIINNDAATPTTNPLDNSDQQFFVRQHYYDFLSRLPDQSGFDFWVSQITQCGGNQTCVKNKRLDVSNAFFFELEYQQTAAYVFRLYRSAYGNAQPFPNPDTSNQTEAKKIPSYAVFSNDRARLIGSANLAQDQLALANLFVSRPEFLSKYSASLTLAQFVDALILNIRTDDGVDLNSQRSALIALGNRGAVLYRIADDNLSTNPINNRAFINIEYNRAFVASQYFGYLRRNADMGGFVFWLNQVNSAPLRDVPKQHAMVCSFITSSEYQQRFSSVVTRSNADCPQ